MTKDKIPMRKSIIALILNTMIFKLFFVVGGILILIFSKELVFNNGLLIEMLFFLGLLIDILMIIGCLLLMYNQRIIAVILKIFYKLKKIYFFLQITHGSDEFRSSPSPASSFPTGHSPSLCHFASPKTSKPAPPPRRVSRRRPDPPASRSPTRSRQLHLHPHDLVSAGAHDHAVKAERHRHPALQVLAAATQCCAPPTTPPPPPARTSQLPPAAAAPHAGPHGSFRSRSRRRLSPRPRAPHPGRGAGPTALPAHRSLRWYPFLAPSVVSEAV